MGIGRSFSVIIRGMLFKYNHKTETTLGNVCAYITKKPSNATKTSENIRIHVATWA